MAWYSGGAQGQLYLISNLPKDSEVKLKEAFFIPLGKVSFKMNQTTKNPNALAKFSIDLPCRV
jgi:hypothetical protein